MLQIWAAMWMLLQSYMVKLLDSCIYKQMSRKWELTVEALLTITMISIY